MLRINTQKELLDFTVQKYAYYSKVLKSPEDMISVYYLRDFLNDLLLIQRYASKDGEANSGEGRTTGSDNVS